MVVYTVFADEILNSVKILFLEIKEDLLNEETLLLYKNGQKDEFIKERFSPLLSDVAFKLKEQYAIATTVGDNSEEKWKSVYFFSDMYYELVTGVLKLISVRDIDINESESLLDVLGAIRNQLEKNQNTSTLSELREYIITRSTGYSDKPFFQSQVNSLLTSRQGVYLVVPPKSFEEYTNDTQLAFIDGIKIQSASTTTLPLGTELDQTTGEIRVSDTTLLVSGSYIVGIDTTVENGIKSTETLLLQIGEEITAKYTLVEAKRKVEYTNDFVLGTVSTIDNTEIVSAFLIGIALPRGVELNSETGAIYVANTDSLTDGTFSCVIRTVDALSRVIDHNLTLVILSDITTRYIVFPTKSIVDYESGEVIAKPIDDSIVFSNVEVNGLPEGVSLNTTTGEITVSDSSIIESGTYTIIIKTIEDNGYENLSQVTIVIGGANDNEAIYTVATPKALLSDYKVFDVLAYPTDSDGGITQAGFIKGTLPPGTALNKFTGEILVIDPDNLIRGKYTVTISTTDTNGGYSETTITISISNEVLYKITRERIVDSYKINELVAVALDPIASIVSASITDGTLPEGLELLTNGNIKVNDPTLLQSGVFTFTVETTNEDSITNSNEISLIFLPDQEAEYVIFAPRIVDTYTKGELIAEVKDPDGKIVEAKILKGNLPGGVNLNSVDGSIFVEESEMLTAGLFTNIVIETKDDKGGETIHTLNLEIYPDIEAVYVVFSPKSTNQYKNGENIATVKDGNAPIMSAKVIAGSLPTGVGIDTSTGTISVVDSSKLKAGEYPLTIETKDELGGVSINKIVLIFKDVDREAVYVVAPAKNIDAIINSFVMASPIDPENVIVNATIVNGVLPPGTSLNSSTGVITVIDINLLVPGIYRSEIITTNQSGDRTSHELQLVINPDHETQYNILPLKKYNLYENADIIATCTDEDGDIETAQIVSGALPSGMSLVTDSSTSSSISTALGLEELIPVGYIVVTDNQLLEVSESTVDIKTTDITGGKTINTLTIHLLDDSDAIYFVPKARMKYGYHNNDKLAYAIDPDGPIVSAEITLGTIPPGSSFNSENGDIIVSDRTLLEGGLYTLAVLTEDNQGGQTGNVFTIVIRDIPELKEYVGGVCERINDLEERFKHILSNNDVINRTIMDFTKVIEEKVCSDFSKPNGEMPWINGGRDQMIRSDKFSIMNPISSAIKTKHEEIGELPVGEEKDRAQEDLNFLTDLYGEVLINLIKLTGMRVSDLPPQGAHPINQLYDILKIQMQSMSSLTELEPLREDIETFTFTGKQNLNNKIAALLSES